MRFALHSSPDADALIGRRPFPAGCGAAAAIAGAFWPSKLAAHRATPAVSGWPRPSLETRWPASRRLGRGRDRRGVLAQQVGCPPSDASRVRLAATIAGDKPTLATIIGLRANAYRDVGAKLKSQTCARQPVASGRKGSWLEPTLATIIGLRANAYRDVGAKLKSQTCARQPVATRQIADPARHT